MVGQYAGGRFGSLPYCTSDAVPASFIIAWALLVVVAYALRVYCVSAIQTQSQKLYELLGKPSYVSRYSWGFLRKASKYPEFRELTKLARNAIRFARLLDVVLTALTGLLVLVALRAFFGQ